MAAESKDSDMAAIVAEHSGFRRAPDLLIDGPVSAHRPIVIINPRSGGGLKESAWAKLVGPLTDGMGEFDSVFTAGPRDATRLAREAAGEGRGLVVAFGGDGTISEVADGILQAGAGATTELGLIPRGTGGDFRRSLELPAGLREAAQRIREAPARIVDAGRVSYIDHEGAPATRHFVNVASFGFSSAVAGRANASSKRFGGKMAFLSATVRALATYDNTDVWLRLDDGERQRRRVLMAAVGKGRFFGGGMKICPEARLDSGTLDLVIVGDFTRFDVLLKVGRLFNGSHLTLEEVSNTTVRKLEAAPVDPEVQVPIELDGETPGRLPATFEDLPQALRLRF
jgi:diacylglycerol kinase (ATP)